jgi:G3E family GTPase
MTHLSNAILVCGFLGSGKTTLLKNIISWKTDLSKLAVLVNEFGDVGVDGKLLSDSGGNVVELASGCICCSIQGDLKKALIDIHERFHPEWILVEATGLADPEGILPVFSIPELRERTRVFKLITVLDVEYWQNRDIFGPLFENQLRRADLILLNKIDLINASEITPTIESISNIFPNAQVIPTVFCRLDPDTIFLRPSDSHQTSKLTFPTFPEHHHSTHMEDAYSFKGYKSYAFEDKAPLRYACFMSFIKSLPINIFRIKGWIKTDENSYFLNLAGGKGTMEPCGEIVQNKLIFIGWDMDITSLQLEISKCII